MAAQTRKNVVRNIAKTISEVSEQRWSRMDQPRMAITVDGLFAAHLTYKNTSFQDDRLVLDIKAFLEQRYALVCDNITVTLAWIPGKEE